MEVSIGSRRFWSPRRTWNSSLRVLSRFFLASLDYASPAPHRSTRNWSRAWNLDTATPILTSHSVHYCVRIRPEEADRHRARLLLNYHRKACVVASLPPGCQDSRSCKMVRGFEFRLGHFHSTPTSSLETVTSRIVHLALGLASVTLPSLKTGLRIGGQTGLGGSLP